MFADLRYAFRQMRKSPGFAATAVVTLALGIGATTAIFSLLNQALLRSLPVRDPQQLVLLEATPAHVWNGNSSSSGGDLAAYFSYPMYRDLRDQNKVFSGLIAVDQAQAGASWRGHSELVNTELVSGNYFDVLGVRPALGNLMTQADDQTPGGNPAVVLSFQFWKAHLAENPKVVGQSLDINGHPFQILGVAAPNFSSAIWGSPADLWVPMAMRPVIFADPPGANVLAHHDDRWLNILGRLRPGVTRAQAQAGLAPLWHNLRQSELSLMGNRSARFVAGFVTNSRMHVLDGSKGFSYSRGDYREPLLVIMAMAALILLMAAVNVASLVLVRAAGRVREIAMRYALGARRSRVVRQLLAEGLVIGIAGGAAGVAIAPAAVRFLISLLASGQGQPPFSPQLDSGVLAFSLAAALAVSLLFTLAPAVQLWKPSLIASLKQQGSGSVGGRLGFRRLIVGAQIALSLLLLVCAGLFLRTLQNLRNVNLGFATDHLITFGVDPAMAGYAPPDVASAERSILARMQALPGVVSAGATNDPEIADYGNSGNVSVEGYTPHDGEDMDAEMPAVTPDYFATLKVPLVAGRSFSSADTLTTSKVAIVNQTFADRFFGSPQKAIGHMIANGAGKKVPFDIQIVGVTHDYIHRAMKGTVKMAVFTPAAQQKHPGEMFYYVRTFADPAASMRMVRHAVSSIDPHLVVDGLSTMQSDISENIRDQRMVATLAVSFGALAALLAAVGLYGVLAYATEQRRREIGVRMALGADRQRVLILVLRDMAILAGISIAVAIPVALIATRTLKSLLFGVSNLDPEVIIPVSLLMMLVALGAAALPARRASHVEPMEALRSE